MDQVVIDYLNPDIPAGLKILDVPLVRASPEIARGLRRDRARSREHRIEIVPWPLAGWRKLDAGTGIEGGTTEGIFACEWRATSLWAATKRWADTMSSAFAIAGGRAAGATGDGRVLLWHCNYHPDGGQLFWPIDGQPFVVPVAPPGDDLEPENFVAFWSDGSFGIYHPSRHLARGPVPGRADRPLLRQAGQGARAG